MNTTAVASLTASRISWRAIFAGAIVAVSIHLLITILGAGISALIARPAGNDAPIQSFTIGLAVTWTLSALVALWVGGCVSGRVGAQGDREGGMLHGFVMWSFATVLAFVLLAAGVGKALSTAGAAAAGAATLTAGAASAAAPDLAKRAGETIDSYSGEITGRGEPLRPATKRQIAYGLKTWLASGDAGRNAQNRQALVTVLTRDAGMTPEDAAGTVDEWAASYDRVRRDVEAAVAEASQKAKDIANKTASASAAAAIWTFIAFWAGAVVAVCGGRSGALGCNRKQSAGSSAPSSSRYPVA